MENWILSLNQSFDILVHNPICANEIGLHRIENSKFCNGRYFFVYKKEFLAGP